jgi:TldD protein
VLAPVPAYTDYWQTPHQRDPFEVPIQEKLELIRNAAAEAKKSQQVFSAGCTLAFRKEDKYFASSVGSSIQQLNMQTYGIVNSTAVDLAKGLSKTRRFQPPPVTAGYEFVAVMNLVENAQRVREEVVEHLKSPPITAGKKDLVLLPIHLWLTIHESLGHSTELDRALGYEANYAGTSFLTTDKLGTFAFGSKRSLNRLNFLRAQSRATALPYAGSVNRLAIFSVLNECVLRYVVSLPTTGFGFACRHGMSIVVSVLRGNARSR